MVEELCKEAPRRREAGLFGAEWFAVGMRIHVGIDGR